MMLTVMKLSIALPSIAALALGASASHLLAADLRTYENGITESWTWSQTKADQTTIEGVPQPVTYSHIGTLATGLRPDSGSVGATLTKVTGPARIDNGLPELPPEPYKTATGTTSAYPVPPGYTGAFGLYNGDVSAYAAAAFPNAMNILSGTYSQAMIDTWKANGGWTNPTSPEEAAAYSRFDLTLDHPSTAMQTLVFQIRIQGMGPTVANQASGTYLTTYDVVQQVSPIVLTYNGTETLEISNRELLSYVDLGVGSRHAYATGGMEEIWEFSWDFSSLGVSIEDISISFTNYPTSVITGLSVTQVVPEPSTWALMALGLGFVAYRLRGRTIRN